MNSNSSAIATPEIETTGGEEPQVAFCDLCNTSIPEADVVAGKTARVRGKRLGVCCLDALAAQGRSGGVKGGSRLFETVLLLGGLAAVAIFLNARVSDSTTAAATERAALGETLRGFSGRFSTFENRLGGLAGRGEVTDQLRTLRAAIDSLSTAGTARDATIEAEALSQEKLMASIAALRDSQPDHRPALDRLEQSLLRVQSELRSFGEMAPSVAMAAEEPLAAPARVEPSSEIPADLKLHVDALRDRDPGVRFDAVHQLLQSRNAAVFAPVAAMVTDEDAFVRRLTIEGLGEVRSPEAVDVLLVALMDDEEIVRFSALDALQNLTQQDIPYDPSATAEKRRKAQGAWQDWWKTHRDLFGPTAGA